MAREIFIKLDNDEWSVHSVVACTGDEPEHTQKQLTPYHLKVAFCTAGAAAELTDYAGATLSLKRKDRFTAAESVTQPTAARLLNPNATVTGSGSSTRYEFTSELNNTLIADDMADAASVEYDAEVSWLLTGSATPRKTLSFSLIIESAVQDDTEVTPSALVRSNRVIYIDDNHANLTAQGFSAYATLQAAMDAAFALTPAPAYATPVVIKVGAIDAGDTTIAPTANWDLVIEGQDKAISTLGNITVTGAVGARMTLRNLTAGAVVMPTTMEVSAQNALIDSVESLAGSVTVTGDAFSRVYAVISHGADGADGTDAGASAATFGSTGGTGNTITLKGSMFVDALTGTGGAGGDGGAGNATHPNGAAGGEGGVAPEVVIYQGVRVGVVTVTSGVGGVGGAGHTNGNGGSGGNGGGAGLLTLDPTAWITTATLAGGAGGIGGVGAGSGTDGADGATGAATLVEALRAAVVPVSDPGPATSAPVGIGLYAVGDDLRIVDADGVVYSVDKTLIP